MATVADRIAEFLHEKGVDHAFGIVGAGNVALFEAISRLGKTQIVCCHHESAAVMSATYFGRLRLRPGVAICTTGAGSSNAITGALAASMDSAPVLVISGNEPTKYLLAKPRSRIAGVQGFWTVEAVAPFVKSVQSLDPSRVRDGALEAAWRTALEPRPGPVWLDIPRDYFNAVV